MSKPTFKRVSMTLPEDLVNQLDRVSGIQQISRSSLVALMLSESVEVLNSILQFEVNPTDEGLKRFRGDSVEFINGKVGELKTILQSMEVRKDA